MEATGPPQPASLNSLSLVDRMDGNIDQILTQLEMLRSKLSPYLKLQDTANESPDRKSTRLNSSHR